MQRKEGLSDIHELKKLGIPVDHDVDREIDQYFSSKENGDKQNLMKKTTKKSGSSTTELCKIKTFGFVDGILQHNMPCPICLKRPAVYVNDGSISFFAPCLKCQDDGFYTGNKHKKGWWFG